MSLLDFHFGPDDEQHTPCHIGIMGGGTQYYHNYSWAGYCLTCGISEADAEEREEARRKAMERDEPA